MKMHLAIVDMVMHKTQRQVYFGVVIESYSGCHFTVIVYHSLDAVHTH